MRREGCKAGQGAVGAVGPVQLPEPEPSGMPCGFGGAFQCPTDSFLKDLIKRAIEPGLYSNHVKKGR